MRFAHFSTSLPAGGRVDRAADAVLLAAAGSVVELRCAMDVEHIPQARGWDWEQQPRELHVRRYALGVDAPTSREFQGGREGVHAGSWGVPCKCRVERKRGHAPKTAGGTVGSTELVVGCAKARVCSPRCALDRCALTPVLPKPFPWPFPCCMLYRL